MRSLHRETRNGRFGQIMKEGLVDELQFHSPGKF